MAHTTSFKSDDPDVTNAYMIANSDMSGSVEFHWTDRTGVERWTIVPGTLVRQACRSQFIDDAISLIEKME